MIMLPVTCGILLTTYSVNRCVYVGLTCPTVSSESADYTIITQLPSLSPFQVIKSQSIDLQMFDLSWIKLTSKGYLKIFASPVYILVYI